MSDPAAATPATQPDRLSALAVVSFILSFVVTFVGFLLGIIALVQIHGTRARGRGLAIAAVVLGAVFSIAWIVIALVALAIPVYLGQQSQAKDAATESELGNAKIAMISYATDHDDVYPTKVTQLADYGYVPTEAGSRLFIANSNGQGLFCLQATSLSNHIFHVTDSSEVEGGTCAP